MIGFFETFADRIAPEPTSGCWLWTGYYTPNGYGALSVKKRKYSAHRCAYEAVNGPINNPDLMVRHRCDVKICCNPDHLEIGTAKDNHNDMVSRGRANPAKGEGTAAAKLTEAQVLLARDLAQRGFAVIDIARHFKTPRSTMTKAILGATWKHLPNAQSSFIRVYRGRNSKAAPALPSTLSGGGVR